VHTGHLHTGQVLFLSFPGLGGVHFMSIHEYLQF
jgi:hypothetical protein